MPLVTNDGTIYLASLPQFYYRVVMGVFVGSWEGMEINDVKENIWRELLPG